MSWELQFQVNKERQKVYQETLTVSFGGNLKHKWVISVWINELNPQYWTQWSNIDYYSKSYIFLLTVWLQECLEDTWKLIMSSPTMMYETPYPSSAT